MNHKNLNFLIHTDPFKELDDNIASNVVKRVLHRGDGVELLPNSGKVHTVNQYVLDVVHTAINLTFWF